jgi:hypothetical protein
MSDLLRHQLSFSIVLGALIMGAATISVGAKTSKLSLLGNILFAAASVLGIGLLTSILHRDSLSDEATHRSSVRAHRYAPLPNPNVDRDWKDLYLLALHSP